MNNKKGMAGAVILATILFVVLVFGYTYFALDLSFKELFTNPSATQTQLVNELTTNGIQSMIRWIAIPAIFATLFFLWIGSLLAKWALSLEKDYPTLAKIVGVIPNYRFVSWLATLALSIFIFGYVFDWIPGINSLIDKVAIGDTEFGVYLASSLGSIPIVAVIFSLILPAILVLIFYLIASKWIVETKDRGIVSNVSGLRTTFRKATGVAGAIAIGTEEGQADLEP